MAVPEQKQWKYPFSTQNFIYLGIGVAVIVVGFFLMATGISSDPSDHTTWMNPIAVDVAPIVLVIGFCVIIPYAIMKKQKTEEK